MSVVASWASFGDAAEFLFVEFVPVAEGLGDLEAVGGVGSGGLFDVHADFHGEVGGFLGEEELALLVEHVEAGIELEPAQHRVEADVDHRFPGGGIDIGRVRGICCCGG